MKTLTAQEELDLFRRFRRTGSKKVAGQLAKQFLRFSHAEVMRIARGMADPEELYSLANEVLWETMKSFSPERGTRFSAYLKRALYRHVIRHQAKAWKRSQRLTDLEKTPAGTPRRRTQSGDWGPVGHPGELENVFNLRQVVAEHLQPALQCLTPREKKLIRLRYFDEIPLRTLARRWNTTPATVWNWERAALKKLHQQLKAKLSLKDL